MKLDEIMDEAPMIVRVLSRMLKKELPIQIVDRDGMERKLSGQIIFRRTPTEGWVFRGVGEHIKGAIFDTMDLRLPADAEIDYLLHLEKREHDWLLKPNWKRIRELGYQ